MPPNRHFAAKMIMSSNARNIAGDVSRDSKLSPELGIKYVELKKDSGPFPSDGDYVVISYR